MHTLTFFDALAEALEVHGYTVTTDAVLEGKSGQIYSAPILAERDAMAILFDARVAGDVADAESVRTLEAMAQDTGADGAVLCHTEHADATAAATGIVQLWDAKRVSDLMGKAQFHKALGTRPPMFDIEGAMEKLLRDGPPPAPQFDPKPPIDVDALLADTKCAPEVLTLPPAFQDKPTVADLIEAAEKDNILEDLDIPLIPETKPAPEEVAAAEPEPIPEIPEPLFQIEQAGPKVRASSAPKPEVVEAHRRTNGLPRFSYPMLPVQVPYDAAVRFAKDKVHGVARSELIVHPVYLYDYECDLIEEGSLRYDTEVGRIEVDGTKPQTQVADVHPEAEDLFAPIAGLGYDERNLRIEPEKALKLAREHIAQLHTRMVEVETSTDDDTFFYKEKRAVAPQAEHIRITPVGMYMRPVWRLVGSNGSVDVDAIDGRRLDENLRNPNSDILIID